MFEKTLVANRGEIACRIMRTCRRMGIDVVAVFSKVDSKARHVRLADEAWSIGDGPARESYLSIDKLLSVAKRSGAEAIHPGYGFLAESAEFSERCRQAGFAFVGPSSKSILSVGNKSAAKVLMARIGAPTLPGFHGEAQDHETLSQFAVQIGFPVVIKASAGGGGRGMRVVWTAAKLSSAIDSARREAMLAFGDGRLLIEKYLEHSRHVEIQFVADSFGEVVAFPSRDCSLQRRHQKLIEESPAPRLSSKLDRALKEVAVEIARAASYVGAGTVEFLIKDDAYYFLEVNARLQVEHPVTEMICGVDLVEWQFRVACGEPVPLKQERLHIGGCAIEARICAEDPAFDFRPSSGIIEHLKFPHQNESLRIDTGIDVGDDVSPYYDSLVAKIIVRDDERQGAIRKLKHALESVELVGPASNLDFLRALVTEPCFIAGVADTGSVEHMTAFETAFDENRRSLLLAASIAAWRRTVLQDVCLVTEASGDAWSPWIVLDGWRLFGSKEKEVTFRCADQLLSCKFGLIDESSFWMEASAGKRSNVSVVWRERSLSIHVNDVCYELCVLHRHTGHIVIFKGQNYFLEWIDPIAPPALAIEQATSFLAPLPARVMRIFVKGGDHVKKGAPILMLEAMKMEIPMNAPGEGVIGEILCKEGQSVREGDVLLAMATPA